MFFYALNILDFSNTQIINESKIVYEQCKLKNKGNCPKNEFYRLGISPNEERTFQYSDFYEISTSGKSLPEKVLAIEKYFEQNLLGRNKENVPQLVPGSSID